MNTYCGEGGRGGRERRERKGRRGEGGKLGGGVRYGTLSGYKLELSLTISQKVSPTLIAS